MCHWLAPIVKWTSLSHSSLETQKIGFLTVRLYQTGAKNNAETDLNVVTMVTVYVHCSLVIFLLKENDTHINLNFFSS